MRLPYNWLKELVAIPLSPKETANLLTWLGLEVEAQEEVGESPVFEIKVTPQRGDCLCALGVARELAAALQLPLRLPELKLAESGAPAGDCAKVIIQDPDLCPRYSARIIRGVKIGISPGWVRQRLEQCGIRPISNIVDVTNLVMLEMGQPLHAFDAELLRPLPGEKLPAVVVRRAQPGEEIITLDGERRKLQPDTLLIADGVRGVAVAGVMGGANSEVHEDTTTILLESAHFLPASIRRTAKALGMMTEASYRFERRVDPGGTVAALDRAAQLMVEFGGGEVAPGVIDIYPQPQEPPKLVFPAARVNQLLGTELTVEQMADYLHRLAIAVKISGDKLEVKSPSFRGDLNLEEDYIEEIARIHGYDKIPAQTVSVGSSGGRLAPRLALEWKARKILLACGLDEVISYSLEGSRDIALAGFPAAHPLSSQVIVKNPKVDEYSRVRTSLLPSLLALLSHNWRRGQREVRVFEIGRVYLPQPGEPLPQERLTIGIAMLPGPHVSGWGKEKLDFYALKGAVEACFTALRLEGVSFAPVEHPTFASGKAAQALRSGEKLAVLGEVAASVLANYDLTEKAFLAEIDLEQLLHLAQQPPAYQPLSRYPAVQRDLALLVPFTCPAEKVEEALRLKGGELLESLSLFDVYEGKSLPAGHRSLAYALSFRAADRTLTESEINEILVQIETALGQLRVTVRR